MQNQKVLEQLGFTTKEAKVYLTTLGLGEAHISDIAAKLNMPRSSVQIIVDKLHKEGFMNFYVMRRYKYWVAENPERLLESFQRREETIREALPQLTAIRKTAQNNKVLDKNHKKSVEVFRVIADASLLPILITNKDAEIEYVNRAWEKEFGYSLAEVCGEDPKIFKSGKTSRAVFDRMWRELRSGGLFQSDEIIDKRKDGTLFNLLTTIFSVTHGNRTFYIQILDDVSKKEHTQKLHENFTKIHDDAVDK